MLQPSPVAVPLRSERLRAAAGRRTVAIGLAVLVEGLMLLVLLTLGSGKPPGEEQGRTIVVNIDTAEVPEPEAQASRPEPQRPAEAAPVPQPPAPEPPTLSPSVPPAPVPPVPAILPRPIERAPSASVPATPARPARPAGPAYGPPDRGRSPMFRDTERVGTAPNGEPMYAAAWYREPRAEMLRDYLSTAREPGWGLIACRTAPDYRVEDCVGIAEYPEGSQIVRAILAAAWEFKVRPPRLGGQPLVGSWVRIRIDYQRR